MTILNYLPTILTFIFLLVILSYYILIFIPRKKPRPHKRFSSISVIIPVHNEEEYIEECIESVLAAGFKGTKQVIVVDDGSKDKTASIVSRFRKEGVRLIKTRHTGKSASINRALAVACGELIAIVDGDSYINKDALQALAREVERKNVVGATCVVKVKNRSRLLCMWPHIELIYGSLIRSILSKINANITTPGPLSVYRHKQLKEIGGFSTEGFSEDVDVTIRLIRKGYRIGFSDDATTWTNMPYNIKGFIRQRTRFARGLLNILKRHMQLNTTAIDLYTLPLYFFLYVQAVIMGMFTIYQIGSGYITWFASYGTYISFGVLRFFFEWASIYGFVKWIISVASGTVPLTFLTMAGIVSSLLSYPLYFYAVFKYDKRIDLLHIIPLFFMAPFWWALMIINIVCLPEMFMRHQNNIWKKNE